MNLKKLQRFAILLFIFGATSAVFSQEPPSVSLITYWEKGDVFKYEKLSGKKKYKAGVLQDSTAEKSRFILTVVSATKDDYLVEITKESKGFDGLDQLEKMGVDGSKILLLAAKYNELKMRYRIDSLGAFLGVDKPEMVGKFSSELAKLMIDAMEKKDGKLPKETKQLVDKLTSPAFLTNKMFQDVQLMHAYFGGDYYLDTLIQYKDELPNLAGGKPIPVDGEVSISWYDEDVVLVYQQNFVNEQNFKNLMKSTIGDAFPNEEMNGTMTDINQYFIEPATGIIYAFFRDRTIEMKPDDSTVEFTEIKLVD